MVPIVHHAAGNGTNGAATNGHDKSAATELGRTLPDLWFARMARELWQFKAAAHLHFHTGRSERTCRAWEAGDNEPGATALAQLIRSEEGPRVLEYIMREGPPAWWLDAAAKLEMLKDFRVTRARAL